MSKWVEIRKGADFQKIGQQFHITPLAARLIRNREIRGEAEIRKYLHGTVKDLYPASSMKGMKDTVEILSEKIRQGKRIRIIGDYDIDGVCAAYILLKGLSVLGANVDTDIPDRIKDGYGLNQELVDRAFLDGIDTVLTCDNGIAAVKEIAYAKEKGMTVLVTDHHEVQQEIPPADAVIDPRQEDCLYSFKKLCGAAVAWKLTGELWKAFPYRDDGLYRELMMFAAFATVGDVMDLEDENRILVREGLKMLRETAHPGMSALIEVNELPRERLSAFHIGFVLGPCINAGGRLDTAKRALELLDTQDYELALRRAKELKDLNDERKTMTEQGVKAGIRQIENGPLRDDRVLVVYLPDCHESLAGIIAGRIREKYYKPVFVLTRGENGVKGSGRSIEAYSMYDELVKCRELLEQFGGHPMAAGLSLKEENVELFRRKLNENCTLTEKELTPKITIDVPMPISYLTKELTEELSVLEPFGKGNTKPLFAQKDLRVLNLRILGKNQNVAKMKLQAPDGGLAEAVYFGEAAAFAAYAGSRETISVTYYPEINTYQGRENLQIVIRNYC